MSFRAFAFGLLVALGGAGIAAADPCEAIPDRGPMPAYLHRGAVFSGHVVYVGDGDSLCVDVGAQSRPNPALWGGENPKRFIFQSVRAVDQMAPNRGEGANWVEVRLADFYAPELHDAGGPQAKAALERIAKGRAVSCVADHRSYDRIVAACRLNGRNLADLMRRAGVREGGRGH